MAEIRINATGGVKLYDADDSHYAQIVAGTITSNVDAITLGHDVVSIVDNLALTSDSAVLKFGADNDTTLTHTDGTGLTLNSTNKLCFNDASQFVQGSSATVLSIGATDEIDLTATAIDINGTCDISGTFSLGGTNITTTAAEINLIDGGTSRGTTALADGDGILINDAGTMRMTNVTAVKTYMSTSLDGIDDQTSSNDDQLTITDSAIIVNEDSDDLDFRIESNGNANAIFVDGGNDRVGIGTGTVDTGGKCLTLKSMGSAGPQLILHQYNAADGWELNAEDATGHLTVADTAADEIFRFDDTGQLASGGETAADVSRGGLCLNQVADDTNIMTFKSSDVAHGMTGIAETDTYGMVLKDSATEGGLEFVGLTEAGIGIRLKSHATAASTTKGTGADACLKFDCFKKDNSNSAAHGSNENLAAISDAGTTRFIFDAEGDFHADSSSTTFDAYDDAQLVRAFDLSHRKGTIESKFDKFIAYNHENLADIKLVGRSEDGTPNNFINITKFQQLHNGAIWQQYEKHQQLLEAVYDLAKEAVGEEKADAILEKHEVKRLQ